MNALQQNLTEAKAVIASPEDWGQGDDRECACALDALRLKTDWTEAQPEVVEMTLALRQSLPRSFEEDPSDWNDPVAQFNDLPSTTHADVMELFDRAIAAAA